MVDVIYNGIDLAVATVSDNLVAGAQARRAPHYFTIFSRDGIAQRRAGAPDRYV